MTRQTIKNLQFSAFRGATNSVVFQFDTAKRVILIFGENGTGKSTIADALDFLCNNEFGSLRLRSGTTPRTDIVAAEGSVSDLKVEMEYGGQRWRATLQSGKPVTVPLGKSTALQPPPRAFVLRRADITRIVEATDGDRYKALRQFITVPHIENAEKALRESWSKIRDEAEEAIRQRNITESTLEQLWVKEGKPGHDSLTWARTSVQQPTQQLKHQIDVLDALLNALNHAASTEIRLNDARSELEKAAEVHAGLELELERAAQTQTDGDLLETLQSAETYLHTHPESDQCPVCAKPEPSPTLLASIRARLTALRQMQLLHQRLETSKQQQQRAEGVYDSAVQAQQEAYKVLLDKLQVVQGEVPTPPIPPLTVSALLAQRSVWEQKLEEAKRSLNLYNALATHLDSIEPLIETTTEKHALAQRLQHMLEIVERERKAYVENTLKSISETVSDLYGRIHPGELLGNPIFGLKKKSQGSITMSGSFGSKPKVSPTAYYSEAHLDTLGLCIYLALAKQAGNALVVLDDVLTSVDTPHLDRIIALIGEESPNFGHVIITTHTRPWFDRMRSGRGSFPAELIELKGWDLYHGIRHSNAQPTVEDLRSAVTTSETLDRQQVAARAGILLEQLLDELTLRYQSKLPRKNPPRYTLGELADGLTSLSKSLKTAKLHTDESGKIEFHEKALAPLIQAATTYAFVRNQVGAHFNPDGEDIPDDWVRGFGEAVLRLADEMLCARCHQLPRKDKSGSYWECGGGCGNIRLYPLRPPTG